MIKENSSFIAVKVPEGSYDFKLIDSFDEKYKSLLCRLTKHSTRCPVTQAIPSGSKIIGLISAFNPIQRCVMFEGWQECHNIPVKEYSQWLILKKK